jgi:UDP-N-acetylglucosamine 2-epimerase (non-hydrolysing)
MSLISCIFGTRPEAIKLAPVILALRQQPGLDVHLCVTAQHRQMLDQVLSVFDLNPDADFDLMQSNQTLGGFTARAIAAVDGYLTQTKPDLVIVQGDTTTVFCATLAAFYHHIPVAHVEAGLRTGDLQAPWPEEANRVLTSRLARLHFAPTALSRQNLRREGIPEAHIFVTGNPVIDALFLARARAAAEKPTVAGLPGFLQPAETGTTRTVLITGHRRENFGAGFDEICRGIARLAESFPEVHFIYPVHLNPRVREPVHRILDPGRHANLHLIEPLPYLPFVALMHAATLILTDSGGVQEEAPSLGKPVLVMRDVTERPEAVEAGTVKLVGPHADGIHDQASRLLTDAQAYAAMTRAHNPYGDGKAAGRIADHCAQYLHPPTSA